MPIPVNPLNDQGLAQEAGNKLPYLNLPLHSVDYSGLTKPLFDAAADKFKAQTLLQNTQLEGANTLANTRLQGSNTLANTQLQGQNELANTRLLGQNQLAGIGLIGQNQLANTSLEGQNKLADTRLLGQNQLANTQLQGQNELNVANSYPTTTQANALMMNAQSNQALDKEKIMIDQMSMRMGMDQYTRSMRGKLGTLLLFGANQYTNNPQQLSALIQTTADKGLSEGLINQQEHDFLIKNSNNPDTIRQTALQDIMLSGTAEAAKGAGIDSGMLRLDGGTSSKNGSGETTGIGGMFLGNLYGNAPLSTKTQDEQQSASANSGLALANTNYTLAHFNPEFFTTEGKGQSLAGWLAGLSSTGNSILQNLGFSPDQIKSDKDLAAAKEAYKGQILQNIMNTLAMQKGVRWNEQTVKTLQDETPTFGPFGDSPDTAFSKLVTLSQRMNRAGTYADTLIKQGLNVSDPQKFNTLVNNYVNNDTQPGKLTFTPQAGQNKGKQFNLSYSDVENLANKYNKPIDQTLQYILQNP